jgi:acyl-coenzyme A thioesterase PaaI-like protein
LGNLKGRVLNWGDLSGWKDLTTSGKTLYTNYIRDPELVYYDGVVPAQGEAHITATSKLSVSGRKLAKAEAPVTAITAITAQGKKIAKAQVHITATTALIVSGIGEEIQVEQGQAHVKTLSSFDVAGEKRARSPPAVLTGETEVAAEGRKVAKGQASLAATSDIKVTGRKVAKKDISITSDSDISIQGKKTARGTARLTGKTEPQTEGRKVAKAEISFTADSELAAEGKEVAKGQVTLTATSEIKVTGQTFDIIHTLTFAAASGDCPIRLYRGSISATSGTVYYRAGTSGGWTSLSVSGTDTTFPVTSLTMQIAHNWDKSGDNYMTPSFRGATNITSIAISQKSSLTGAMGTYFMYYYAYGCSSLTSLAVPDTSGLTSVGTYFMYSYASDCSSLTSLAVPDTSGLTSVGTYFMYSYASDCSSLTSLAVPDTSSLESAGNYFMYYYAYGCSSLTSLAVPDTSGLTSVGTYFMASYANYCSSLTSLAVPDTSSLESVGNSFMAYYAEGCSKLTSLAVPDTSSLESVGDYFMRSYAERCSKLTKLVLPAVGWFEDNNVNWSVPSGRLGVLEGHVLDSDDLNGWKALTAEGKTLHTNYIRDPDLVYYGGTEPAVTTLPATSIGHDSATLNGSLASLGFEPSVDVYFEFRKTGASTWSSTTAQAKTTRGTFSANISGLGTETEYEFRAVVAWDSETAYGDVEYFETEAEEVVAQGEAHIIATSKLSVSGRKIAKAEALPDKLSCYNCNNGTG